MISVIIDFEFTGLDNTFTRDNEIVQMKAIFKTKNNVEYALRNFATTKPSGAGAFLCHKIDSSNLTEKFSKATFEQCLNEIGVFTDKIYDSKTVKFYGYSPSMDLSMLRKYGIEIKIKDIRELLQLSQYEERLAKEGNNLETAYYIVTGKIPDVENHGDIDELLLVEELFDSLSTLVKKDRLEFMPYGHCAGMPIIDYVSNYRRQSDGYRFNNTDALSDALKYHIESLEDEAFGDDDEIDFGENF